MTNIIHLARLAREKAVQTPHQTALRYRDYKVSQWKDIDWQRLDNLSSIVAAALLEQGVAPEDRIGIFSQNKAECLYCETAAYALRAVAVPLYATSTTAQIEYIIKDAAIQVIFVGEQYQYDRAFEALQDDCGLRQVVIFDPEVRLHRNDQSSIYFNRFLNIGRLSGRQQEVETLREACSDEDLANILYTSGTTGNPKGVMLYHGNFRAIFEAMNLKLEGIIGKNPSSMSFLPMTHILEKAWAYYCLENDIRVDINLRPTDIQMTIKEVRPFMMCSVPRFWEKVYAGIQDALTGYGPFMQKVMRYALNIGKRYNIDYQRNGKKAPWLLGLRYRLVSLTVFSKIKKTVGIENGVLFPTAGAKLSDEVCLFMRSIGIPICYGYGLTESTATVACFDRYHWKVGSVGTLIEGLQARIDENGEILLKGPTITPGYYHQPQANEESFTPDGFFRTGDAGYFDEEGHLFLTDRLKDLFKTSNGKYIVPQNIETALSNDHYIEEAVIVGDQRKFVSALIVPDFHEIPKLLEKLGISDLSADDMAACLRDPRVHHFFEDRIRLVQKDMAGFEQIRRFVLLPEKFSMEKGELTNTLKTKRKVIYEHYIDQINQMYEL